MAKIDKVVGCLLYVEKLGRPLSLKNSIFKTKILSPDENPVGLLVSLYKVACANGYIRSISDLYSVISVASCAAKLSIGQESDLCAGVELRCQVSKTFSIEPFFLIMNNGFKELFP